jgi:deoxyribodipyrimidine photo-lyase
VERLTTVVTAYAPVGPVADALAGIARALLRDHGITLVEQRRRFDEHAWPHAIRGYFALKTRIPDLIASLANDASDLAD